MDVGVIPVAATRTNRVAAGPTGPVLVTVEEPMADLAFVAVIIVFFALCLVLVRLCDRIVGPDDAQLDAERFEVEATGR